MSMLRGLLLLVLVNVLAPAAMAASNLCDLNGDGTVSVADVQLTSNQALNLSACTTGNLIDDGCTSADVYVAAAAALTGVCSATGASAGGGTPLFGTASSGMNLPISFWGLGAGSAIWDSAATANLQSALHTNNSQSDFTSPYWTIKDDSFATYFITNATPYTVYPLADASGNAVSCPGGGGTLTTVKIPNIITTAWNGVSLTDGDQHLEIVDTLTNQMYAFYSFGGQFMGLSGGKWEAGWRACDYLKNPSGDAPVAAAVARRASCSGYPCAGTTGIGLGAAVSSDRNGYMSPYGDIMPQDFDDTGWTGNTVGTLHHALYMIIPPPFLSSKAVWPVPAETTTGSNACSGGCALKNGQIVQLDPNACSATAFDASCFPVSERRIAKTLMVYGAVLLDYGNYGPKFSGQYNGVDGNGVQRFANPWTAAGTPGLSAAAYSEMSAAIASANSAGVISLNTLKSNVSKLHAVLAHGAVY